MLRINVEAYIKSFAADVTSKQIFCNDDTIPIEAVYCFPIEEQAAIYSFIARIDDREIVAQLKEKKEAQKEYSDALQQEHGAYLLEQDEKSQDNFIINVGALPPGKECHISISYVSELDLIQNGSRIRFVVPTTIAPRYNPTKDGISSPTGITSQYVQTVPYTIEFHCRVDKVNVSQVSSTSHPIQVEVSQDHVYVIKFVQQNIHLGRDILLDIELASNHSNTIVAVEPGAVMASFIPTEGDLDQWEMGTRLDWHVKPCYCLKSLPMDCHFNIIRFGSNHEALYDEVVAIYNEKNAQKAERLINQLRADFGGTELLEPLKWLEKHLPRKGHARQIFLMTDGEITNVNEVLDLCRSMISSTRIFSFGLGHSPSRSLVKGLARATNGRFVFIPPNTSVDIHVGEQLQRALQPCIAGIEVKWSLDTTVISAPTKIPPVYANDRLIVYALANNPKFVFHHHSSVQLHTDNSRLGTANIDGMVNMSMNGTIARLAAKALIRELQHSKLTSLVKERKSVSLLSCFRKKHPLPKAATAISDKELTKRCIIELSLKYQILSPHTAFIGVEKQVDSSNADIILREVPIQISTDDQHLRISHSMNQCTNTMPPNPIPLRRMQAPMAIATVNRSMSTEYKRHKALRPMPQSDSFSEDHIDEIDEEYLSLRIFSSMPSKSNYVCSTPSSREQPLIDQEKYETWPIDDQNIVRYLIGKQKFDGLWDLDVTDIEHLTGQSLTSFPSSNNKQILISAIVIVALETRFASLLIMWYGVVQKGRKRLLDLLDKDVKQLESLLKDIRQQF
ncbi:unnamed protein product [Rotaria sp. Silwood2]|nr:unnamed protein product [Rotaria sp. Silwood2]